MIFRQPRLTDVIRERAIFYNRLKVVKIAILLALCLLAARSLYLQVIAHEKFAAKSENNRVHLQAIAPNRGIIKDFFGRTLATNKSVQSVFFSPAIAKESGADNDKILAMIGKILRFGPLSQEQLKKRFSLRKLKNEKILIKNNISKSELSRLMVRRHRLPGLVVETSSSRYYPYNEAFAHSVGYLGLITQKDLQDSKLSSQNYRGTQQIGKTGVERYYEDLLHGEVGWQKVEVDAKGRVHRVLSRLQPTHGSNLHLGLDARMQELALSLMSGKRGSIIAIEPATGRLIVLLSSPSFNPNLMVNGVDAVTYKKLVSEKTMPFFNRFARGRYPPASTIKPMYALSALEAKVIHPKKTIKDPGYFQIEGDNHRYRNWYRRGHGIVNMERAIRISNDTYFFSLANQMGYKLLSQSLKDFGFGKKVAIDVDGESPVYIPTPEWKYLRFNARWFAGDNLNMGIGQGFVLSTPLQLAAATSVLANRGRWVRPRLLLGIDNKWVKSWTNTVPIQDVSADKKNWETIINAMVSVTSNPEGTGYKAAKKLPYKIAGKTGTSQVINLQRDDSKVKKIITEYTRDHALFTGFAPVKNPQIVVTVIIENGGSGGSDAAPLAVELIDSYIRSNSSTLSHLGSAQ